MDMKAFFIGFGIALSLLVFALPELTGFGKEKIASQALPPAPEIRPRRAALSEEEISARKDYRDRDWHPIRRDVCEPVEFPWGVEVICHHPFERPVSYDQPRRGRECVCPRQRMPEPAEEEPEVEQPERGSGLTMAMAGARGPYGGPRANKPRWVYGPPIFGDDGRWHRTRRLVE